MKKYKMFFLMIFQSLIRRRARMAVALLAVAIGATIISGMITVYKEVPEQLSREFRAYGANVLLLPPGEKNLFSEKSIIKAKDSLKGFEVIGMTPFLYEHLTVNKQPVLVGGTDFEVLKKVSPYFHIQGDFPTKEKRQILLGTSLAEKIARNPADLIGQTVGVSLGEGEAILRFEVAGIVSTGGKEEDCAFINLHEMQKIVGKEGAISLTQVSIVAEGDKLLKAVQQLKENANFQVQLVQQIARSEYTVLGKLQALVFLVTGVVLFLTLISVTTTMMAVVTERRKEIGLKKALGASNVSIVWEFLGEGAVLGAFGGIFGAVLGYFFANYVSLEVFARRLDFSPTIAILSVVLSILVTGLASLIPVRIATRVDPAIVLRGE